MKIQQVVAKLNNLLAMDYHFISKLVLTKVECNQNIQLDSDVVTSNGQAGVIGLMSAFIDDGRIGYEMESGHITRFVVLEKLAMCLAEMDQDMIDTQNLLNEIAIKKL